MKFDRKPVLVPVFLGIFTFLGSLVGFLATCKVFLAEGVRSAGLHFLLIACAYFFWGMVVGARYSFDQKLFRRQCIWFWLVQAPVLNSPYFSFHAVTGAFCVFWFRMDTYDVGFVASVGSEFDISTMSGSPFLLGINILAVAIVLLLKILKVKEQDLNENFP